jgi:hypothetical protein
VILSPLDPSADEARDWLRHELAKGIYDAEPSLTERLREWLQRLLSSFGSGGGAPAWLVPVVVLTVLALLGLLVWRLVRRDPAPVAAAPGQGVLDGVRETAPELLALARAALDRGDAEGALVAGFRAVVAAAVARTLIDDLPGRTAHEAATALTRLFPDERGALTSGAVAFDGVRFGGQRTDPATAAAVLALHDRLAVSRPALDQLVAPW